VLLQRSLRHCWIRWIPRIFVRDTLKRWILWRTKIHSILPRTLGLLRSKHSRQQEREHFRRRALSYIFHVVQSLKQSGFQFQKDPSLMIWGKYPPSWTRSHTPTTPKDNIIDSRSCRCSFGAKHESPCTRSPQPSLQNVVSCSRTTRSMTCLTHISYVGHVCNLTPNSWRTTQAAAQQARLKSISKFEWPNSYPN